MGFTGSQNCRLGQSDHQAFYDVGIPSALFIWLDYRKPALPASRHHGRHLHTEPEYHRPTDGMTNISPERLQTTLDVVGGAFAHNAMNRVESPTAARGAKVTGDCGDGVRNFGGTGVDGKLEIVVPHVTCDFKVVNGSAWPTTSPSPATAVLVSLTSADGSAGGPRVAHAVADAGHAGLLRRVHAGDHEDLHGFDDGQRDLDRGRRDAERGRPEHDCHAATWSTARSPCRSR